MRFLGQYVNGVVRVIHCEVKIGRAGRGSERNGSTWGGGEDPFSMSKGWIGTNNLEEKGLEVSAPTEVDRSSKMWVLGRRVFFGLWLVIWFFIFFCMFIFTEAYRVFPLCVKTCVSESRHLRRGLMLRHENSSVEVVAWARKPAPLPQVPDPGPEPKHRRCWV